MRRYRELVLALLLQAIGGGAALLVSSQAWQRITATRQGPFADTTVAMSGRDVDAASTALALVALAGVVAVLATRGWWRRLVGAIVAIAGGVMAVRAVLAIGPVTRARASAFVADHRQTVSTPPSARVSVEAVTAWPVLTVGCGLLVLVSGLLVTVRGGRWQGMSARYEREAPPVPPADTPEDVAAREGKAAAAMWSALDRGDDPTA